MKWFYDLKIGKKLIISFLVLSAITAIVGYLGVSNMGKMSDMLDYLYKRRNVGNSLPAGSKCQSNLFC